MSAARTAFYALLGVAVVVLVVLVASGGSSNYHVKTVLDNADGLRSGSPVVIGGVPVGTVKLSIDKPTGKVLVDMSVKKQYAPVGRDASAGIVALNLLGQKQVDLTPGDRRGHPADSGFTIAPSKVTSQAALDQVLDVLDAPTRDRLAIFVNEAGAAFAGRREDFNSLLHDLAPTLGSGTQLLRQLDTDNAAIGRLVQTSDRYVATTTAQRHKLVQLVDRVGQTAQTVATKRVQLRSTLATAPGALHTLGSFLDRLRAATVPLGPAATKITRATTPLRQAQDALGPFTGAAKPTLKTAKAVAPTLTRLASGATPVLRNAVPTLRQVRSTAVDDLPGVADTLMGSIDNTASVFQNWSRAIQFRDGLSHIFRGEASIAPDALASAVKRLSPTPPPVTRQRKTKVHRSPAAKPVDGNPPASAPHAPAIQQVVDKAVAPLVHDLSGVKQGVDDITDHLAGIGQQVGEAVGNVTQQLLVPAPSGSSPQPQPQSGGDRKNSVSQLLNYLLGP